MLHDRSIGGRSAEKLFLIQCSVTAYQRRDGPKLPEVYNVSEVLKFNGTAKSPLQLYSECTKISSDKCYFIYACTERPNTRSEQPKLYYLKVDIL